MPEEDPIDEDTMDQFHRLLDEIFGRNPPTADVDADKWASDAEEWFSRAFDQFRDDIEELMEHVPELIAGEDEVNIHEEAVMDAWVDGRHYEITITRLPDGAPEDDEPEVTVRHSAVDDQPGFDDDFVAEWA